MGNAGASTACMDIQNDRYLARLAARPGALVSRARLWGWSKYILITVAHFP